MENNAALEISSAKKYNYLILIKYYGYISETTFKNITKYKLLEKFDSKKDEKAWEAGRQVALQEFFTKPSIRVT